MLCSDGVTRCKNDVLTTYYYTVYEWDVFAVTMLTACIFLFFSPCICKQAYKRRVFGRIKDRISSFKAKSAQSVLPLAVPEPVEQPEHVEPAEP